MDVCNLKGWGLRVNKLWSDADYMSQRGPTYFAVFTGTTEQNLTLVPGTVRQLTQNENTRYWYFQRLPVNVPFEQYEIREVSLTNPVIGTDGEVESYDTLTVAHPIGNAQPIMTGETDSRGILYLGELQLGEYCLPQTQRRVCVIFTNNNNKRRRLSPERGGRRLRLQLFEAMALRQNLNDN